MSQLLKWANHHQVEVTIRGAGTGTTGGAISITKNQIVVSLKEMNKVIDFDLENATLTVEPGVVLAGHFIIWLKTRAIFIRQILQA